MEKIYGAKERLDGVKKIGRRLWAIFYGFGEDAGGKYYFREIVEYRPSVEGIREMILSQINANVDEKILSGMTYDGAQVWLSAENQLNYKDALYMATITDGKTLPVKFKFGTTEEPVYKTFNTVEELEKFYSAMVTHIQTAVYDGWVEKDNLDMTKYAEGL